MGYFLLTDETNDIRIMDIQEEFPFQIFHRKKLKLTTAVTGYPIKKKISGIVWIIIFIHRMKIGSKTEWIRVLFVKICYSLQRTYQIKII